jgi:hypothetical protein
VHFATTTNVVYECQVQKGLVLNIVVFTNETFIMSETNASSSSSSSATALPPGWIKGYSNSQKKTYYCHPEVGYP